MMNARAPKLRSVSSPAATKPTSRDTTAATTPIAIKPASTQITGPTMTVAAKPLSPGSTGATTPIAIESTPLPEMAAVASPGEAKSSPSLDTTHIEDNASIPVPTSTTILCSSVSDKDSLFEEQSDQDSLFGDDSNKEVSPIVSKPESPMDNTVSTKDMDRKRKVSGTISSPADDVPVVKKIRTTYEVSPKSSLLPPAVMAGPLTPPEANDTPAVIDITKKRKTSEDVSSFDDNFPSAKRTRTSEPSSARSPSVDIDELLLPTKAASPIHPPTIVTPPTTPSEPASKPTTRRRKVHSTNPFRTDLRMGVRGDAAAGTGTVHRQPAPRPPRRITEPNIASPIEIPKTPEEQEALDKLIKTQNKAADEKKHTVLMDKLVIDNRMKEALIRSDRSAGKKPSSKGVPQWRKNNPDWQEGSEVDRLISDAIGNRKFMPSKYAGMSAGTKKLVQVTSKGEGAAKNMNSTTFSYGRQVDKEKDMEREKQRVRKEVELQEKAKAEREREREREKMRLQKEKEERELDDLFEE
ncbi:hypothetical protein GRF29_1g3181566 [Pseudopithomyces chartarum]|uniref:Uncharacterized protein n=1 Tax=Pseudopithomyces chartarum TaxID=1892770 RepID=A0AAN6M8W1_9PLEO|nr:hypothetical protein GRF29_1g3181566 [Pseudopithomyces chartarum]